MTVNWASPTTVRADAFGAPSPSDLRFGSLTTVNLRLFADLGGRPRWLADHPWFRGFRIRLSVDNLFNQRPDVRDGVGAVPAGYQADLLNPLGRRISLSIRKQFR
jgi:outer membrane receptor protein involved in Fe transport